MNTKRLFLVAGALLLASASSCKSPAADIPCRCGTPMTDLEGCAHPRCLEGEHNPDNPDCVCGNIEIPAGNEN